MVKTKTLVGIKRFQSKKNGKNYCVAVVITPFNESQQANGSIGCSANEEFLPDEFYNYLQPTDIGLPIQFGYDVVGGRAYITNVTVARPAAK